MKELLIIQLDEAATLDRLAIANVGRGLANLQPNRRAVVLHQPAVSDVLERHAEPDRKPWEIEADADIMPQLVLGVREINRKLVREITESGVSCYSVHGAERSLLAHPGPSRDSLPKWLQSSLESRVVPIIAPTVSTASGDIGLLSPMNVLVQFAGMLSDRYRTHLLDLGPQGSFLNNGENLIRAPESPTDSGESEQEILHVSHEVFLEAGQYQRAVSLSEALKNLDT